MKKIIVTIAALACLTSCYEPFVKDFDKSAIYFTYQYDMRTMVVGEGAKFDITACLGGVIDNAIDRGVKVVVDDALVTADLSKFALAGSEVSPFTAYDVFGGLTPDVGMLYHTDVQKTFAKYGLNGIKPLPSNYYTLSGIDGLEIKKGSHQGAITVSATDAMMSDSDCLSPMYAIGVQITDADADEVLSGRNFAVITVRLENMFYGNWYHGGSCEVYNASGSKVKEESYPFAIPQEDAKIYTLSTIAANAVKTDKYIQNKGSLILTFNGKNINITSDDLELLPDSRESYFNESVLLQDRELHLNYTFKNADGGKTVVSDILYFRDRVRDGAREWQDEVPEHYK